MRPEGKKKLRQEKQEEEASKGRRREGEKERGDALLGNEAVAALWSASTFNGVRGRGGGRGGSKREPPYEQNNTPQLCPAEKDKVIASLTSSGLPFVELADFPVPPTGASRNDVVAHRRIRQAVLADGRQVRETKPGKFFVTPSQHPRRFTQLELDRLAASERNRAGWGSRAAITQSTYTDIKRPHTLICDTACAGRVLRREAEGRSSTESRYSVRSLHTLICAIHPIENNVTSIHFNYRLMRCDGHLLASPK